MRTCLFLGDSITDADHCFADNNLGYGYVARIAQKLLPAKWDITNRGHDGFTVEQLWRMLHRDGIEKHWDLISILIGVNDVPVEVYTSHPRIPTEFEQYYREILCFLKQNTRGKLVLIEPFLFDKPAAYKAWQIYIQTEGSIIQKLAKEFDALFVSTNQIMQDACTQQGIDAITPDGIHLTPLGNQLLADLWLAALDGVL